MRAFLCALAFLGRGLSSPLGGGDAIPTGLKAGSGWSEKFVNNKIASSKASAASKGAGQVEASSGWGESVANADGSEGSLTNSDISTNQEAWNSSWSSDGASAWNNDFSIRQKFKGNSKSAHQGNGNSRTAVSQEGATGSADGTRGAAVDNQFARNSESWKNAWGASNRNGVLSAFSNKFSNVEAGGSEAKVLAFGASSASGRAGVDKSMVEGEGSKGAQASTNSIYQADQWNDSWGKLKDGENFSAFTSSFANKINYKGDTATFGVGNAAVKGMTSSASGSKAVGKGISGSGTNTAFKGNKNSWNNSWTSGAAPLSTPLPMVGSPLVDAKAKK